MCRFEHCEQDRLEHVPSSDGPGGDSIDARIEKIEADESPIQVAIPNQLARNKA